MAKVYVYDRSEFNNYHSGGGVVVIANTDEERDAQLAEAKDGEYSQLVSEGELTCCYTLAGEGPLTGQIFLFPNAGCC